MSAFVVSHETINLVINTEVSVTNATVSCEKLDELGNKLLAMNQEAVNYRYPHDQQEQTIPFRYEYGPLTHSVKQLCRSLKALDCFLYQCNEGSVPVEFRLYRRFKELAETLRQMIVGGLPDYKEAAWDI